MPDSLRHATLRQLQIFLVAAEHGGFGRAAQALHLTQPAVSMQMAQLSAAAGQPLFERAGRSTRLTEAGQALLPHAQRIAQTLRDASESLDALKGLRHGHLRVAVVATTQYFAPRLLARFRAQHPGVQVDVLIGERDHVIALLEKGQVDLAIMGRPPVHLPLVAEPFAQHPHGIIAPTDHPLAGKRRIEPRRLLAWPFVAREPGSGTRHAMTQYFAQQGLEPTIAQEMTSNESLKQAVMAGLGLAFISLHTVSLEHQTGHLVLLDAKGLPVVRSWYVLHLAHHRLPPSAQALKRFMHEDAPKLMGSLLPDTARPVRRASAR